MSVSWVLEDTPKMLLELLDPGPANPKLSMSLKKFGAKINLGAKNDPNGHEATYKSDMSSI